ncbi:protein phosphatase 1L-like [Branchiostoma floridae]|uniref:Protein phosphatase 1L n=1 Tax=Branchiostoma floridae TaxID=7739 RepID=A0A9J7M5G8_BRAFL|nr:protein phosphatase 1L-like [Branchiostoma floridae]
MAFFCLLWRVVKHLLFRPETWLMTLIGVAIYSYVHHWGDIKAIFNQAKLSLSSRTSQLAGIATVIQENHSESSKEPQLELSEDVSEEELAQIWEFRKDNVAVYAIQGRREHMEDRYSVITNIAKSGASVFEIFDGHGGDFAAEYAEKKLTEVLEQRLTREDAAKNHEDHFTILTDEILSVDKKLVTAAKTQNDVAGTTALVALLEDNQLTVANVGDSRGVICDAEGRAIPLSFDHKPQILKERKRIKKAGGFISYNGVWRVQGVLATSRALGDYPLKDRSYIVADPDILSFDLRDIRPQFMILATDGLWDAFSNEEAVDFIKERLDEPHFGAKSITLQAFYRGSLDNITVMVVNFRAKRGNKNGFRETSV